MEISKMLTVSTAHITKETAEFLDKVCKDTDLSELIVYEKAAKYGDYTDQYGWFIYCNVGKPGLNIPNDLMKLMCFTSDYGVDWLCLDRDGEVLDNGYIDVYEW